MALHSCWVSEELVVADKWFVPPTESGTVEVSSNSLEVAEYSCEVGEYSDDL